MNWVKRDREFHARQIWLQHKSELAPMAKRRAKVLAMRKRLNEAGSEKSILLRQYRSYADSSFALTRKVGAHIHNYSCWFLELS